MAAAYFVSEQWIRDNTAISGNVDAAQLMPFVRESQDQHVQELVGSALYARLLDAVANSTVNADEAALLTLIRPSLAWHAAWKALPFLAYQIRPKGAVQGVGEGVQPADLKAVQWLRDELRNNADFHAQRVVDHLAKNSARYPQYANPGTSDIYPAGGGYTSPVAFDSDAMTPEQRDFYRRYLS